MSTAGAPSAAEDGVLSQFDFSAIEEMDPALAGGGGRVAGDTAVVPGLNAGPGQPRDAGRWN